MTHNIRKIYIIISPSFIIFCIFAIYTTCHIAVDLAIRCYCTTLPPMMSEPPTSKTDGSKVVCGDYRDCNDTSSLDKRPVHADHCSVAGTDEISKLKASSRPDIKLVFQSYFNALLHFEVLITPPNYLVLGEMNIFHIQRSVHTTNE